MKTNCTPYSVPSIPSHRSSEKRTGASSGLTAHRTPSVMNAPFGAYPSAYISFSGQFTSRIVPIVLHCIVTHPLFISTIAPIVPMSLLSCTLLFSLVFPRP